MRTPTHSTGLALIHQKTIAWRQFHHKYNMMKQSTSIQSSNKAQAIRFASGQELFDENGNGIRCYVIPLHGIRDGRCTCGEVECRNAGKHPWVNVERNATNDPQRVAELWKDRPDANIGIVVGMSGLIVIDPDAYKPDFDADGRALVAKLTSAGSHVVNTRAGGAHYYFLAGADSFGNDAGGFPPAVDVRAAHLSYVVAPGSLHWTGTTYSHANKNPVRKLPAFLRNMLVAANSSKGTGKAVTPTGTGYRPARRDSGSYIDTVLETWRNPIDVFRHFGLADNQTPERGQTRLAGNGGLIVDGERWFWHSRGVGGGSVCAWSYLSGGSVAPKNDAFLKTIDAMAAAAGIPKPAHVQRQPDAAIILRIVADALQDADFRDIVPHRDTLGRYRTGTTDRRVAHAALGIMQEHATLSRRISALQLSERTGLGDKTCKQAMQRLSALFDATSDGEKEATVYTVKPSCVHSDSSCLSVGKTLSECTQLASLPLDTHNGHDAFYRSMKPLPADREPRNKTDWRRKAAIIPSAGPDVLLAMNQIERHGAMNRTELGERMYKGKSAISRIVGKGLFLGLLVENAGKIDVSPEWRTDIDRIVTAMPTFGHMANVHLDAAQKRAKWAEIGVQTGKCTAMQAERALERFRRLERAEKGAHSFTDYGDMPLPDLGYAAWDAKRNAKLEAAQLDLATERRADQFGLAFQLQQFQREGVSRNDAQRMIELAGYTRNEARTAIAAVYRQ